MSKIELVEFRFAFGTHNALNIGLSIIIITVAYRNHSLETRHVILVLKYVLYAAQAHTHLSFMGITRSLSLGESSTLLKLGRYIGTFRGLDLVGGVGAGLLGR